MSIKKKDTTTGLVTAVLKERDDFMSLPQLIAATGHSRNQVTAALHNLKGYKAVDAISAEDALWWFLTEDTDTRSTTHATITEHTKKRRTGYKRKPKGPSSAPAKDDTATNLNQVGVKS